MRTILSAVIVILIAASVSSCALIDRWSGVSETRRIQDIGVSGEARILQIWDTGMTLNDNPVVGLRVRVDPRDGQPYEVEIPKSVSRVHLAQFQPGQLVPVKIDPQAPGKVALNVYLSGGR